MLKKITLFGILLLFISGLIFYFSSTKLFKNKVKQFVYHKLDIIEADWKVNTTENNQKFVTTLNSPSLIIDDIYTSMEGPYVYKKFKLNQNKDNLYWIQGFKINAKNESFNTNASNDFICHANLYHSNIEHFSRLNLDHRIGVMGESQLITLTQGCLDVQFPDGFGYPVFSNEKIIVGSQALNLNKKNSWFQINYDFELKYSKQKNSQLKPLYMQYITLALPYKNNPFKQEFITSEKRPYYVSCAGPESNSRHESINNKGEKITAFWKIPVGKHTYTNEVTQLLNITKKEVIHFINIHVHPYAKSLELVDITTNTSIFKSDITNFKDRKGIKNMTSFSSIEGVTLFPDHQYKMKLIVNNTTNKEIDMMASMLLYFYDKELADKLDI